MKAALQLVLVLAVIFVFSLPGFAWCKIDHQILYEGAAKLAANDGGEEFRLAAEILKANNELMKKAVIAPDENPKLVNPPLYPPLLHGHDPFLHIGFSGLESSDSERLAIPYCQSALEKWNNKDFSGALYDLGCVLHLVQNASVCVHSNFLGFKNLSKHSALENWILKETAPDDKPRSFEDLCLDPWLIEYGGIYLKSAWKDEKGKLHWTGGLESWIDVAAHLSYDHLKYSITLDDKSCDFQGQTRQQFVNAQRCGAGLLVDFFRRVGVVEEPWLYYLRRGEVWRVRLHGNQPERAGDKMNKSSPWKEISPIGYSKIHLVQNEKESHISINAGYTWTMGTGWDFPNKDWPFLKRISFAFFPSNYFLAIVDASEGDDWKHLYLLPSVPHPLPSYYCPRDNPEWLYYFTGWDYLEKYYFEVIDLP